MNKIVGIKNLADFESFLEGKKIYGEALGCPIIYSEDEKIFLVNPECVPSYRKMPELTMPRFLEDLKLMEAIHGKYIPIINMETKEFCYSKDEYDAYRRKMGGIKEFTNENYEVSDNLYFKELEPFLEQIDRNEAQNKRNSSIIAAYFTSLMNEIGLSVTIGNNSGGDIELVEAGSTSRHTNIPDIEGIKKGDFDYTVRMNSDKVWKVKEVLETKTDHLDSITRTSAYKVRLLDVLIPGLDKRVDLDFSLTPQKEKYVPTEDAISERLENIRKQDEDKYRLVVANIMYAKYILKKSGAYKPSRSNGGDPMMGGLGGIGIENWILQYGGSFIDAATDFVEHANGKNFTEFEKEYAIMDFGKNHVSVSKKEFPYDNFVMANMRPLGYETMRSTLNSFINEHTESKGIIR